MALKINIPDKSGKTFKVELETEFFNGKNLGNKISGKEILPDLSDYEFEISGASDKSGFTAMEGVPGIGLKKALLSYGKGMHKRQKFEGKKKRSTQRPKGLRLKKTVRGETLSEAITQINLRVVKEGKKPLTEIFESQAKQKEAKPEEKESGKEEEKSREEVKEKTKAEEKKEEVKKAESKETKEEKSETEKTEKKKKE